MLDTLKKMISEEFGIDPAEIKLDSDLRNDLHIDSLGAVNLSLEIEVTYDIQITDEELAELKTVGNLLSIIEAKTTVKDTRQ